VAAVVGEREALRGGDRGRDVSPLAAQRKARVDRQRTPLRDFGGVVVTAPASPREQRDEQQCDGGSTQGDRF
jgi:hypothetical protein